MRIREFAKMSGVTVKTLIYYDKIGILKPAMRNESGYRIYSEKDLLKLQQIITLKYVGLSLSDIKDILCNKKINFQNMISLQRNALEDKKKHIEAVIEVLNKVEAQTKDRGVADNDKLIEIIRLTNIENRVIDQYKTDEKLNTRNILHSYNINKADWNSWCFEQMIFPKAAKVLELGCGTGSFWYKNKGKINREWSVILSDFSTGMLNSAKDTLKDVDYKFCFDKIDAQNIPYEDESFDVVIARHMLYLVPDIEKALAEAKRVLKKDGVFYVTTNSRQAMQELNELVRGFDASIGLHNNGMCDRFDFEGGEVLLKKYFSKVEADILEGKIIVDRAEPVVEYKASTIKGSQILTGDKKKSFKAYIESYLKENGPISITTKACIFKAQK